MEQRINKISRGRRLNRPERKGNMRKVEYEVEPPKSIWGVTIRILDSKARMDTLTSTFAGFTIDDAINTANAKLNKFGYYIEK